MVFFLTLLIKLIPLYLIILLGFISSKVLKVNKESVASLLLYIIGPGVIFYGTANVELNLANISLPFLFFIISSLLCITFLYIGKLIWKDDSTKNILAFTAGTGNTGYFGLPVALVLFDYKLFSLAVLSCLGFVFYQNSIGFFITAKGNYSFKESVIKVVKLPTVYSFFAGLFVNLMNIDLGMTTIKTMEHFQGAFTILGMMIIGMGLSGIKSASFDYKFLSLAFIAKFLIWPLLIGMVIILDLEFFHIYNSDIYKIMVLMSIVPLAANTVVVATELKVHPDKAAIAVLLSTLFALFYIPLITVLFLL